MNWRLTSELVAYFLPGKKEVWLAALEKKQYQTEVIKMLEGQTYQELRIYENQFDLCLGGTDNSLSLYAKASEFPDPNEWYEVKNFYAPGLWKLLETHTVVNGLFEGNPAFEVGFEDSIPYVTFIEPKMKDFKKYFEEMKRRMNCELCKKTTKWVPGHRYDTLTESVYYLATVKSRKKDQFNSEYQTSYSEMPDVIIYASSLNGEKSVGEVLMSRAFGDGEEDLKIMYGKKSMVDAGEVLTNDFTGDIQDYWGSIYKNSQRKMKSLKDILDIFSVTNTETIKDGVIPTSLVNNIKEVYMDILVDSWNLANLREDMTIGDSVDTKENANRLKKLLISSGIKDGNFLKGIYYPKFFEDLGIDMTELAEEVVTDFRSIDFNHDFDSYLGFLDYWKNPARVNQDQVNSRQRIKSTKYKLDIVTLKDLYGDTELKDVIIETANKVRDNFGLGATEYNIINVGTKKEPLEYIFCKITLEDIIKYKKGVSNLSETLKSEILQHHFVWVQLTFDKDGVLS